jgi:hypothetical protein
MSDTTVTTEAPIPAAPAPTPLPNDAAARSSTGEILEPSQIAAKPTTPQATPAPDGTSTPKPADGIPAPAPAPDAYAFKAPEGYTVDDKLVAEITPIFKELGLSQDAAQKLFDVHAKTLIDAAKAPEADYTRMRQEWTAKAKSDPDMAKATNGDKVGLDAVKLDMGRALNALGDPGLAQEFKSAMDLTGAGDHPAFIKTFWKLAQFVTEGKHVGGSGPSVHGQQAPGTTNRPSAAASLYPNLPH